MWWGVAWVAHWRAFTQTQKFVFWWFLQSYFTSALFSCWYFLLLKHRIFWYYSVLQVMAILCCVAKKAASAAQSCKLKNLQIWKFVYFNNLFHLQTFSKCNTLWFCNLRTRLKKKWFAYCAAVAYFCTAERERQGRDGCITWKRLREARRRVRLHSCAAEAAFWATQQRIAITLRTK